MKKIGFLLTLFHFMFALAESDAVHSPAAVPSKAIIFDIFFFEPQLIYQVPEGVVEMQPKNLLNMGVKFSYGNFDFGIHEKLSSSDGTSSGFEFSYNFKNTLTQFYSMAASNYILRLKPDSGNYATIGERPDISAQSFGINFMMSPDNSVNFSLFKARGSTQEEKNPLEQKLKLIYYFFADSTEFKGNTALTPYETVNKKSRLTIIPGVGFANGSAFPIGYMFVGVAGGVGYMQEDRVHATGTKETLKVGAYGLSGLINFVYHKTKNSKDENALDWFSGMAGTIHIITPFDKNLIGQRHFLISTFVGMNF